MRRSEIGFSFRRKMRTRMKCLSGYWAVTLNLRNWLQKSMNRLENSFSSVRMLCAFTIQLILAHFLVPKDGKTKLSFINYVLVKHTTLMILSADVCHKV